MIEEFIDFVSATMPCISPYTKEGIKLALEQFKFEQKKFCTTMKAEFEELSQGDILENIPFYRINRKTGKIQVYKGHGIVLNNTCDCSRDDNILIAPFIPIENLNKDKNAIIFNTAYGYLYFPDKTFGEETVDFSLANTFNRELILKGINVGEIKKSRSLNGYGYYLFICKLTVYLLRPEDVGVNKMRIDDCSQCG